MKIKVDENNFVVINLERGGRIVELVLGGRLIIQGNTSDTGSGNYLLYPWVNRIQQSPFKHHKSPYQDANQLPIHGLYVDEPRQAEISPAGEGSVSVKLTPQLQIEGIPLFSETYTLSKGKLSLKFVVYQSTQLFPFCFGYHPYLQIDNEHIANLKLFTDIQTDLKLDQRLLPLYPFQRKQVAITATDKLDNLFQGGSFLQIETQTAFAVRIKSDLPYWQIYTPPDGKRIAVEPMSFPGNVYKISQSGFKPTLHTGYFQIEAWQN